MSSPNFGVEIPGGFFKEEGHQYRNAKGVIVPSNTQVFEINGLSDFSMVNPDDLEWKRVYGSAVHDATLYSVQGDLDWDTLDSAIQAPVQGIKQRLDEMEFEVEAAEEVCIANVAGMECGMRLDLRGMITHLGKRRKAVIDLKTGSKFSKTWEWQVGGYIYPQTKVPMGWMGIVLQVAPTGKVTPHYLKDVEAAKREFHVLLAAAILKLNYGFAQLRAA
jgi:hypothetical protein